MGFQYRDPYYSKTRNLKYEIRFIIDDELIILPLINVCSRATARNVFNDYSKHFTVPMQIRITRHGRVEGSTCNEQGRSLDPNRFEKEHYEK